MKKNENASQQICPKCGQPYRGRPALSRDDNCTAVCASCGVREAMSSMGVSDEETEKILEIMRKAHAV